MRSRRRRAAVACSVAERVPHLRPVGAADNRASAAAPPRRRRLSFSHSRHRPTAGTSIDQSGKPFRIHGEAAWDAPVNLALNDLTAYLNDRQSKGFNALLIQIANPVAYVPGSSVPWAVQLGGRGAGVAALPFTNNTSGSIWDGDP